MSDASPVSYFAVCSDSGYLIPAVVMLTSAKMSKAPQSHYCIHFVVTEPCEGLDARLDELRAPDFEIHLHRLDISHFSGIPCYEYITLTALARFELPELLPELNKIVYLDCDALVLKDLSALYATEPGDCPIAAVSEAYLEGYPGHRFNVSGGHPYINSGILVMNLELMRQENLTQTLLQALRDHQQLLCMDQDALNYICQGRIHYLPVRYNWMPVNIHWGDSIETLNERCNTSYASWQEMNEDVAICHFAGARKPWDNADAIASDLWMHVYNHSPWRMIPWQRSCDANRWSDQGGSVIKGLGLGLTKHRKMIRLFGLPFILVRTWEEKRIPVTTWVKVSLFGLLPLWTYQRCGNRASVKLFGCLPLLRIKG